MTEGFTVWEMQHTVNTMRSLRAKLYAGTADIPASVDEQIAMMKRLAATGQSQKKIANGLFNSLTAFAVSYQDNRWSDEQFDKLIDAAATQSYWGRKQKEKIEAYKKRDFALLELVTSKHRKKNLPQEAPRRLRVAERILSERTSRFLIIMEKTYDDHNRQAVLRTAEALGIQNVWSVKNDTGIKNTTISLKITKGNDRFLTLRNFQTSEECLKELRAQGWTLWATDLSRESVDLDSVGKLPIPEKLAIIFGTEATGVSELMLEAAEKRVYLPLYGFTESLNLSVATALVLQRLFQLCPEARGNLTHDEKHKLRQVWYKKLSKEPTWEYFKTFIDNPPPPAEELRQESGNKHPIWIPRKKRRALEEAKRENAKKQKLDSSNSKSPE